jgi:glycosyltransferase involved in cell wall biosynthesis
MQAMGSMSTLVFWQPIASPHQEAFLEAVARRFPGEVILGVERSLPADRIEQGWRPARQTLVRVVDLSLPEARADLERRDGPDAVHVFSGFFSHPLVWSGFRRLARSRARLAVYSEAPEQPPATGWLKRLRGRLLMARWARRIAFVLAIGGVGCEFFARVGVPAGTIVPFGYSLDVPPLSAAAAVTATEPFRFVAAGQLIRRKGIDLLLEACGRLPAAGWSLDIYGEGPERNRLGAQADRLGLAARARFHGVAPQDAVSAALAAADCAVMPSRFDGWGMVASEALGAGTPVICTGSCGAAALADVVGPGMRVVAADTPGLVAALESAVVAGRPRLEERRRIRDAMAASASADAAAERFLATVDRFHG